MATNSQSYKFFRIRSSGAAINYEPSAGELFLRDCFRVFDFNHACIIDDVVSITQKLGTSAFSYRDLCNASYDKYKEIVDFVGEIKTKENT